MTSDEESILKCFLDPKHPQALPLLLLKIRIARQRHRVKGCSYGRTIGNPRLWARTASPSAPRLSGNVASECQTYGTSIVCIDPGHARRKTCLGCAFVCKAQGVGRAMTRSMEVVLE